MRHYELDIFDYVGIYKREWKRMAFLIVIAVSITAIISFLQPIVYKSTLTAISSKDTNQGGKFGNLLGISLDSSLDTVIFAMLKSRLMREDVNEHFNLHARNNSWWTIETLHIEGGFAVEVRSPDPDMTQKIANWSVENLRKLNDVLVITPEIPKIKVLDPALRGVPVNRQIQKKCIASGLLVFLVYALFVFFREYFSQLKKRLEKNKGL